MLNWVMSGTIGILWFRRAIIVLLCPWALLGHSRSIIARRKHKIPMVPFNSASKTKQKNQPFKYGGQYHWAFVPHPIVYNVMYCVCSSNITDHAFLDSFSSPPERIYNVDKIYEPNFILHKKIIQIQEYIRWRRKTFRFL